MQMDANDACDPDKTPRAIGTVGGVGGWRLSDEEYGGDAIIDLYPRRAVLAFNLALIRDSGLALRSARAYDYEETVQGLGDVDPGGSSWGVGMEEQVESMLPFSDEKLAEYLNTILPTPRQRVLLGETLTQRLVLTAPVLSWMSYDSCSKKHVILPRRLEPFVQQEVNEVLQQLQE